MARLSARLKEGTRGARWPADAALGVLAAAKTMALTVAVIAALMLPAWLSGSVFAQGASPEEGKPSGATGEALGWPPDVASVQRLISSKDYEPALSLLKGYISMLPGHAGEPGFDQSAADLAEVSGFAAEVTGDYPGLEEAWKRLLASTGPAGAGKSFGAAVNLGLGVTYASGAARFPAWERQASQHLSAVVYAGPFTKLAKTARQAGREYGVRVALFPMWVWGAGVGVIAALAAVVMLAVSSARRPRPRGVLGIMSPSGAFGSMTVDLSKLGPGRGAAFYLKGGRLTMRKTRGDEVSGYSSADAGTGSELVFTVSANSSGRHGFSIWIPQDVEIIDPVYGSSSNYGSFNVERNCEIRGADVIIQVSGLLV